MKEKLLIIGNGIAATRLITELLAIDDERFDITVVGDEPQPGYNRILLSKWLAGDIDKSQLITQDFDWYETLSVTYICGQRVVAVNPETQNATLDNGQILPWDKLVFATGSSAFIPPIDGVDMNGIYAFRSIADSEQIMRAAPAGSNCLVVGGGLLGLEAAYGLSKRGANVTLVHNFPTLMNRQLTVPAGRMLQASMEKRGITFELNANCKQFLSDGRQHVKQLVLDNGHVIECDMAVIATGISPNTQLAKDTGLDCKHGICIDGYMRTSADNIYAIGECAQWQDVCIGLVEPIHQQAPILASVLCDVLPDEPWEFTVPPTRLKVSGEDVFSAGDIHNADVESLHWHDPISGHFRQLLVKQQQLVGIVLYGDTEDSHFYHELYTRGTSIKPIRNNLLFGQTACEAS